MPFLVVEGPPAGELALVLRHLDRAFAASAEEHFSAHSQELVPFSAEAALASSAGCLQLRLQVSQLAFVPMEQEQSKVSEEQPLARALAFLVPPSRVPEQREGRHSLQVAKMQQLQQETQFHLPRPPVHPPSISSHPILLARSRRCRS
jgi:hypothetical protein